MVRQIIFVSVCLLLWGSPSAFAHISFADRWFSPHSPWNSPIGDTPVVMPYSEGAVRAFLESGKTINMNLRYWTPPVIYADSRKDKVANIYLTGDFLKSEWVLPAVPVPQALIDHLRYAEKHGDTDKAVCLYDEAKRGFYSFWALDYNEDLNKFSAPTGGFSPIDGPGWSHMKQVIFSKTHNLRELVTPSLGPAGGSTSCGGLIRVQEMKAKRIDHALSIHWPKKLILGWKAIRPLQYPATATDGLSLDMETSVPHGARLQLDPSLTDAQLKGLGLNDADIIVAHALQIYGGYITDATPAPATINFENVHGREQEVYGVTNPWPTEIARHFRFVGSPPFVPLDTAQAVKTPVPGKFKRPKP